VFCYSARACKYPNQAWRSCCFHSTSTREAGMHAERLLNVGPMSHQFKRPHASSAAVTNAKMHRLRKHACGVTPPGSRPSKTKTTGCQRAADCKAQNSAGNLRMFDQRSADWQCHSKCGPSHKRTWRITSQLRSQASSSEFSESSTQNTRLSSAAGLFVLS